LIKENEDLMKKAVILTLLGLVIIVGLLAGIKAMQIGAMIDQGKQFTPPPEIVTSTSVMATSWESLLTAVGSLDAVQGVIVTAEETGKVVQLAFESGKRVPAGDLLVQQDVSVEQAQLKAAEALSELARINFERAKTLLPNEAISRSDYDSSQAQLTQALAEVENMRALIAKKTIRAPFAGRLGIRQVNLGQVINDGQAIVSLQSLGSVFVNFSLPQQQLAQIRTGLQVRAVSDALPGQVVTGKITAIESEVDSATRNVRVQALLSNPDDQLRAGMFANVTVVLPKTEPVLSIPATAVLYAPYSDSVFVIDDKKAEDGAPAGKIVRQQFVSLGEKRGDFIVVTSGLTAEETIVSTGVFKLRNGQGVVVDNKLAPEFKLTPQPDEG
jgi:membrane fusion protein (multidrug efflux system)